MTKRKGKKRSERTAGCWSTVPPTGSNASGLPLTIPIGIPAYWSPDEALAVFELVDDIRERVWAIYRNEIEDLLRRRTNPQPDETIHIDEADLPF